MGKQAPAPPDPEKTAAAQTKSNIDTAVAQTNLNHVDQTGPGGSIKYTQIGTNPDGTPKYGVNQSYSPELQRSFDAATTSAGTPLDLSSGATEARLMQLGQARLDPLLAQRRQDTETDLINRGIRPGSDAYGQARDIENQGENDAYNQLLLTGHQQAVSDALAQHNSPINDFNALNGTTQQLATPQTGVAGTDYAGLVEKNYDQQMSQYNQQQSDLYGGLFGLGKAAIGLIKPSDERLKTDIKDTGAEVAGVPVKTWDWKATGKPDVGVIAQDVEKKHPNLVLRGPDGIRRVDYGGLIKLGATARARAA